MVQVSRYPLFRRGLVVLTGALLVACGETDVILEGEREAVRANSALIAEGDAPPALQLSKAVANSDWTHENGATTHFAGHVAGTYPLVQVWSTSIGRGSNSNGEITSGPIVADGRIFAMDANAQVRALSLSGSVIWSADLRLRGERSGDGFGGGVAFGDGTLVAATGYGEVIAVEPESGEIRWRQKLDAPVRAAPTVAGGLAYVVSRNDQAFGIDLKNGRIRWRTSTIEPEAGILGGASPAVRGGLVVLPFASGEVVGAVARNGRRAWTASIPGGRRGTVRSRISDITGDPVIVGNTVYVANQSGRFAALDRRSGQRLWSVNEGSTGPALPIGDSVFFVTDTGMVKRLRASDGAELWSVALAEFANAEKRRNAIVYSGPMMVGERLLIATSDGQLLSFDPSTGAALGQSSIGGGGTMVQPAVTNGTVLVLAQNGTLYAFQ